MRKNNKGLTLVELIIAIAILTIASIAIVSFMVTGTKSYASSSTDINLQYEAQLVTTQIQDLMVDATEGVNYWVEDPGNPDNYRVVEEDDDADVDTKGIDILTWTKDEITGGTALEVCRIRWYKEHADAAGKNHKNAIFYTTYTGDVVEDADGKKTVTCGAIKGDEDMLMGEYIDTFKADLSNLESRNSFKLTLHMTSGSGFSKREYGTTNNITLRNTLLLNRTSISGNTVVPGTLTENVTGIAISPKSAIVKAGATLHFSAVVKGVGSDKQAVRWYLDSDVDPSKVYRPGTAIDTMGNLKVADDETQSQINVYCSSVYDASYEPAHAIVYIKNVTGVDPYTDPSSSNIYQNNEFKAYATVTGTNINSSPDDQAVIWSIEEGEDYLTRVGTNIFKVASNCPEGYRVVIRATSALDKTQHGDEVIIVKKNTEIENGGDEEEGTGNGGSTYLTGPDKLNRGGAGIYKLDGIDTKGKTLSWEVVIRDEDNEEVSGGTSSASGTTCTVKIKKTLNYEKQYKAYITCYVIPAGKTKADAAKYTIPATIPPVALEYKKSTDTNIAAEPSAKANIYYCNSAQTKFYYTFIGIEDVTVEFNEYDKKLVSLAIDSKKATGGRLNVGGKSSESSGETTAYPYINGYRMARNPVTIKVAPGNIYIEETYSDASTNWQNVTRKKWFYLPLPSDPDFAGDKVQAKVGQYDTGNYGNYRYYTVSPSDNTWYYNYAYVEEKDMWYVLISKAVYIPGQNWPWVGSPFKCSGSGSEWVH